MGGRDRVRRSRRGGRERGRERGRGGEGEGEKGKKIEGTAYYSVCV